MIKQINTYDFDFLEFWRELKENRSQAEDVSDVVKAIINDVRKRGDEAILEYTLKFDKVDFKNNDGLFKLNDDEWNGYIKGLDQNICKAIDNAAARITKFHNLQKPNDVNYVDDEGSAYGVRWDALHSVGLYVPGGTASYPSSVLMNAIPAKIAGVEKVIMVVPTPRGEVNPYVFYAAKIAGVDEIYRIGGAQAVAALAYGTKTVPKVDKITGPGNAFVAEAKRQVFGEVGIDMIAGPSEVLILADKTAKADFIAADMIAQAEHDKNAQAILISDSEDLIIKTKEKLQKQLENLPRKEIAEKSLDDFGLLIKAKSVDEMIELANIIAPEHLELHLEHAERVAAKITRAGAIFVGEKTPEAIGDYNGGTNHVLPTNGTASFASGLSVYDFLRRTQLLNISNKTLNIISNDAIALAELEGLEGHGISVKLRNME